MTNKTRNAMTLGAAEQHEHPAKTVRKQSRRQHFVLANFGREEAIRNSKLSVQFALHCRPSVVFSIVLIGSFRDTLCVLQGLSSTSTRILNLANTMSHGQRVICDPFLHPSTLDWTRVCNCTQRWEMICGCCHWRWFCQCLRRFPRLCN